MTGKRRHGETKYARRGRSLLAGLAGMTILALGLAACGAGDAPSPPESLSTGAQSTSGSASPVQGEGASSPSADEIRILWETGPHAATYVLDEADQNSRCARCHAPVNWVPTMDDLPESCASCKFDVEPPPPVIPEADWTHVECMVCHEEDRGQISPQVAWLEIAPIGEYSQVDSVTDLCDKCHLAADIANHLSVVVGGDHEGYVCTRCHDAHATSSSCQTAACHDGVLDPSRGIAGHDEEHENVSCVACHDTGGMEVAPGPDGAAWTTYLAAVGGGPGVEFVSHSTQRNVSCERCHFDGNPWRLSVDVTAP